MGKSSDTTDVSGPFFSVKSALLVELGCAGFLLTCVLLSHAWRRKVWEDRRALIPKASVQDMLDWLEERPVPGFKEDIVSRRDQRVDAPQHRAKGSLLDFPAAEKHSQRLLDINLATAAEWERLPGWGKVLSNRTVKFRKSLGGFVSVDQLKLVYGLDASIVEKNRSQMTVQAGSQSRLCLDTLSFRTLVAHPLFDADQTRRVLRAFGRSAPSMDVFWKRLSPDSLERSTWDPYLGICEKD